MYNQLATYEEANQLKIQLGTIGGGVVETYIPEYEGPFTPPENGAAKFLHFRFANGAEGFNVGLIRAFMQYAPLQWPLMIATEVEAARKVPESVVPAGEAKDSDKPTEPAYMPIDFSKEIRPGQAIYASSPVDREPLGARFTSHGVTYQKRDFPNGMMSFRAWQKV